MEEDELCKACKDDPVLVAISQIRPILNHVQLRHMKKLLDYLYATYVEEVDKC